MFCHLLDVRYFDFVSFGEFFFDVGESGSSIYRDPKYGKNRILKHTKEQNVNEGGMCICIPWPWTMAAIAHRPWRLCVYICIERERER